MRIGSVDPIEHKFEKSNIEIEKSISNNSVSLDQLSLSRSG